MASAKTQPARGMRDFLPADVRRREYVIGVIKEVYERYGFEPLETPAVENIETLMGKYGEEGNQLIFKILKRGVHESTGEADLALRYDLTVPLARVVAEYRDKLPKFFKRYQIQPVWRADRPARGRFREFYQCDVDVLGSQSMVVEAEICAAASEALTNLDFTDFTIRLNHRKVLTGILDSAGVTPDKHDIALVALDKLDKIGPEGVAREFNQKGIAGAASTQLVDLFMKLDASFTHYAGRPEWNKYALFMVAETMSGQQVGQEKHNDVLDLVFAENRSETDAELREIIFSLASGHTAGAQGIRDLHKVLELTSVNSAGKRLQIDPSLARGLSYYSGSILEIAVRDLSGSLGGGGRYDNLVGMFLGEDVPACGFSLGLERIIVVMTERGMFPADLVSSPADVMVTIWNENSINESIGLAQELRSAGLRVDLYPEADKVGKQFKYASSRGIQFVAVVGDHERDRGEVAIKDMRSGEQRSVKRDEVAEELRKNMQPEAL